jgi:hypothetical protein
MSADQATAIAALTNQMQQTQQLTAEQQIAQNAAIQAAQAQQAQQQAMAQQAHQQAQLAAMQQPRPHKLLQWRPLLVSHRVIRR